MDNKKIIAAIIAVTLSSGGFAIAQDRGENNDRGRNQQSQRGDQGNRGNQRGQQQQDQRQNQGRSNDQARGGERGAGPNHEYYRGGRMPMQYRSNRYVVDDWRGHNLSAPPRGYHWVQSGGDYVLVAIATGVIMQLLLNN
jgi:Ni/Co efflux regulator RcnB